VKFAYADPPYLGCGRLYARHHPDAMAWDDPETHRRLIERLSDEWPDGWALSLHAPSLRTLLPMCPPDVRVGAACKDFCQIRTLRVQYAWEPVIWRGGRSDRSGWLTDGIVRDWINYGNRPAARTADSLTGRKPMAFSAWVFDLLGAEPGDTLDDLFPGTGAVMAAWHKHMRGPPQMAFSELFA
jgi:hypothetical protein